MKGSTNVFSTSHFFCSILTPTNSPPAALRPQQGSGIASGAASATGAGAGAGMAVAGPVTATTITATARRNLIVASCGREYNFKGEKMSCLRFLLMASLNAIIHYTERSEAAMFMFSRPPMTN